MVVKTKQISVVIEKNYGGENQTDFIDFDGYYRFLWLVEKAVWWLKPKRFCGG